MGSGHCWWAFFTPIAMQEVEGRESCGVPSEHSRKSKHMCSSNTILFLAAVAILYAYVGILHI